MVQKYEHFIVFHVNHRLHRNRLLGVASNSKNWDLCWRRDFLPGPGSRRVRFVHIELGMNAIKNTFFSKIAMMPDPIVSDVHIESKNMTVPDEKFQK